MALALGAATKDIGIAVAGSWPVCAETHSRAIWALDWGGILVNVNGDRFYNESSKEGFYGRMTEAGMLQPGGVYWVILDEKIRQSIGILPGIKGIRMGQVKDIQMCKKYKADTVEELAKLAGVNPEGLKKSLEKYNTDVEKLGYDTVFNRTGKWGNLGEHLETLTPPFYAIKCVTSLTSMKGGLKINEYCQVLNNYDEAIPGLYAGGELTGGLWTKSYLLGLMTSFSMAQGIIAGRNAVNQPIFK
jgi:fumarate reductase flavoprotein subunit